MMINSKSKRTQSTLIESFRTLKAFLFILMLIAVPSAGNAQIKLPRLIRDSMILQRDLPLKIWGWASAKEKVTITFQNKQYKTEADADGNWKVDLPAMHAGGPYSMQLRGKNVIQLNNILIGDVWFCSGQSNMEHQMRLHAVRYKKEIANSANPMIRQFLVARKTDLLAPQNDFDAGSWIAAAPETTGDFSAVAYFFAKALCQKYGVPIGIINASVGGSPIEAWMGEDVLQEFPKIAAVISQNKDTAALNKRNRRAETENAHPAGEDKGMSQKWFDPAYNLVHGWRRINIPGYWEDQGIRNLDGIVWYRKTVNIPAEMADEEATVFLGRIVDADELYINGQKIGNTTYMYPQRIYPVPAGVLKPGDNVISIRVTNFSGKGGFVPDKPYYIAGHKDTVDLKGYWQYKVGRVFEPLPVNRTQPVNLLYQPTALYNAMAAPVKNYRVKGFLWYQGESNTGDPGLYEKLLKALIGDWRKKWQELTAPFLYVQLPGFMDMNYLPEESSWAEFREAQRKCLAIPHTGMAVTIDVGEWNDVHPDRKKEVGDRLALQAEQVAYGEKGVYSGPMYVSQRVIQDSIELTFSSTGSGLVTSDREEPQEFEIAGRDKKYMRAKALIRGDKVLVWNERVPEPAFVRYAWADNPVKPNLYNREGLPASPFTTDSN